MMRFLSRLFALALVSLIFIPFEMAPESDRARDIGNSLDISEALCSSFCLVNNGYAVFGTNLDSNVYEGLLYINKRGLGKTGFGGGSTRWISKYASITFAFAAYHYAWSGMNEKGLVVSTMGLDESVPPAPDERYALDSGTWLQYVLDMCETIDDLHEIDSKVRIIVADHYLITDRKGNSAVVEFLDGRMVVHRGEGLPVAALTNNKYTDSLQTWHQKNQGQAWDRYDPSLARFVRVADRVAGFESTDADSAVNYAFDTLYDVRAEQFYTQGASQWSIVYDCKNMRIYFRTFFHPEIRYLDFYKFDLACDTPVKMLDIHEELSGDVSEDFFDFSYEISYQHFLTFCQKWGVEYTPSGLARNMSAWASFPCTGSEPADEVLVSKGVPKHNADTRFAVNASTGDVLVVWNQLDSNDPSFSRIRSVMLRRSLTGRYRLSESVLLSDTNGFNANPYPVYLEDKNQFLVVWDQADPNWPSDRSDILGRIVSAGGLPEGGIFKVLADGNRNERPQVYAKPSPQQNQSKKDAGQKVSMVFSAVHWGGKLSGVPELKSGALSGKFKAKRPLSLIQGEVENVKGVLIPERILPAAGGQFAGDSLVLTVIRESVQENGKVLGQAMAVVVDDSNRLADAENIGKPGASRPCVAVFSDSKDEALILYSVVKGKKVLNNVMSLPVDGRAPLLTLLSEDIVYKKTVDSRIIILAAEQPKEGADSVPVGNRTIGYQLFAATNGNVYRRAITDGGKLLGPFKNVFEHDKSLQMMCGTEVSFPDSLGQVDKGENVEMLILWQKWKSSEEQEIQARFLSVKR